MEIDIWGEFQFRIGNCFAAQIHPKDLRQQEGIGNGKPRAEAGGTNRQPPVRVSNPPQRSVLSLPPHCTAAARIRLCSFERPPRSPSLIPNFCQRNSNWITFIRRGGFIFCFKAKNKYFRILTLQYRCHPCALPSADRPAVMPSMYACLHYHHIRRQRKATYFPRLLLGADEESILFCIPWRWRWWGPWWRSGKSLRVPQLRRESDVWIIILNLFEHHATSGKQQNVISCFFPLDILIRRAWLPRNSIRGEPRLSADFMKLNTTPLKLELIWMFVLTFKIFLI